MELVDQCLDLPAADRESLLVRADPAVSAEARRLLEADARSGVVLDAPAGALVPSALRAIGGSLPKQGASESTMVGPFRLLSLVGEGGMGQVWIAERAGADFRQRVAVKLLHTRGDAAALASRFRLERRILARLAHPRIARLLDGGTTEDGTPWLAMEYVEGLSLTEHCAARGLSVEERLQLFAKVCDAVQFAHRNLVVHRDLKPSNVLVGADGEPKLLDFGIAKLLEDDPDDGALAPLTRTGERPMTPDYAAPEQVRGEAATTATDVWALGIILHELLCGVRPFRGGHKSVGEIERAILDAAPSRPSTHADAPLKRRLRGDLDAIVLKALRAAPEDRYPSAEALASDVRRHLGGLPVTARGETAAYLLRSFVRRYRLAVSASALGLAVVLAGLGGTLWQAHRAREEARKAEQVQDFLLALLQSFDPSDGRSVTERDILARGEDRLEKELSGRPDVQAKLWRAFGRTWLNLGAYDHAKPDAQRAIALARSSLGPRSEEEGLSLRLLSEIDGATRSDMDEAVQSGELACSILRERRGEDDLVTADACLGVGGLYRVLGDFPRAARMSAQGVSVFSRIKGDRSAETLSAIVDDALVLGEWGKLDEAVDTTRRVVPVLSEVLGPKALETLVARYNLAFYLVDAGHADEAEPILRAVADDMTEVLGGPFGGVPSVWKARGRALVALGRPAEGLELIDRALAKWTSLNERSESVAGTLEFRAIALRGLGRLAEAEDDARRALEMHQAFVGDNQRPARARSLLGSVLLDEGRTQEGRAELARALVVQERILWPTHPHLLATRSELARADSAEAAAR
jgi:tetratricopeptide (TPR) repeat protein/tRNA A-37 threonylcarbamoyl transferase component Bud32